MSPCGPRLTNAERLRRVWRKTRLPGGRVECVLEIPLGRPRSRLVDEEGRTFEVEQRWRFRAGPGMSRMWRTNTSDGNERAVGYDLLPAPPGGNTLMYDADNLAAVVRKLANR